MMWGKSGQGKEKSLYLENSVGAKNYSVLGCPEEYPTPLV
jgi:hypothetical protein